MNDTLTIPSHSEQKSLDFGYVGAVAVAEVQKSSQKNKDNTLAKAKEAARITASDLVKQFGKPHFLPETLDLFGGLDDSPAQPNAAPAASAAPGPVALQPTIDNSKASSPAVEATQSEVLFPFTEANLKSAKPFIETSPRLSKPLPLSSSLGREQERIRQAQELAKKPVVGLMRTIHTSDGKMRRSQLADSQKIESVAKTVAPQAAFDPWGDMVRKRIAEQANAAKAYVEDDDVATPKPSYPRPR